MAGITVGVLCELGEEEIVNERPHVHAVGLREGADGVRVPPDALELPLEHRHPPPEPLQRPAVTAVLGLSHDELEARRR